MGGSGKTQLALEFCRRSEANGRFASIFWVDATDLKSVAQSFAAIAEMIFNKKVDLADADASVRLVIDALSRWQTSWLIVFDNFDQPDAFKGRSIKDCFPRGKKGRILFTSRHAGARELGHLITVTSMSESEGLELLLRRSRNNKNDDNSVVGKEIVRRLGCLALAIDQAGAYIFVRRLSLNLFMDHYNNHREKVLEETPELWDYTRKLGDAETETTLSAFTTWEMSFEQIGGDDNSKRTKGHLLTMSAFFDNKDIFEELFKVYFELKGPGWMEPFSNNCAWSTYEFQDVLAELSNLSLLQILETRPLGSHFSLHPLIQDWMKLRVSPRDRRTYATEAISMLAAFIDAKDNVKLALQSKQTILSHLDVSVQNDVSFLNHGDGLGTQRLILATLSFASFYHSQGRYTEAEQLYGRALAGSEKQLGPDHPETLRTVHNLAIVYQAQGRYTEAEQLYGRALAGNEKLLGPDHPETLRTVHNLAIVYRLQGRYTEAEQLYGRALAESEKQLGPDHPETLRTVHNLAIVYQAQGRYTEAEQLYGRALAGNEKQLGPDHPDTLRTVEGLAIVYRLQGRYTEAEQLYGRALAGNEKQLGPDHPETLRTVHNLAIVYQAQGRYTEAEQLYGRALAGSEKQLGPDHPDTLRTVEGLAIVYRLQGRYTEAEQLYGRALAGNEKQLGPDHPDTLRTVHNLAIIYKSQGRYTEAEQLFGRALAGNEKQLGPDHPYTLQTAEGLVNVQRLIRPPSPPTIL